MRTEHLRHGRSEGAEPGETAPVDALPDPLFASEPAAELVTDPEGVIREVSPSAGVLLRSAPAYLEGVPLRALVHRADRARLLALLAPPPSTIENDGASVRVAVPGGIAVTAEMTPSAARDDKGFVVGLRWRVHERRPEATEDGQADAEPALRRRLERLAESGQGVCLLQADGRVTWMGPIARDMLRWDAGQVVGNSWAELAPQAGSDPHSPLALALRRGREGSGAFREVLRGDGTIVSLDYVVLPLLEGDRVLGAALAFTEVGAS
jgi:PAS domain-containing protein